MEPLKLLRKYNRNRVSITKEIKGVTLIILKVGSQIQKTLQLHNSSDVVNFFCSDLVTEKQLWTAQGGQSGMPKSKGTA
jgi:hypothetical protein